MDLVITTIWKIVMYSGLVDVFHEAKVQSKPKVKVWELEKLREFLHVDDLADASLCYEQKLFENTKTNA